MTNINLDADLDLDSLLTESVKLADARKAAKKGAKLTAEQQELIDNNRLAEEMQLWQDIAVYAHMQESLCDCGNCYKDFQGFYLLQRRRFGKSDRLIRVDSPVEGLEVRKFLTYALSDHCYECVDAFFPDTSPADCSLLSSLGSTHRPWIEHGEEVSEDLLAELEAEAQEELENLSGDPHEGQN